MPALSAAARITADAQRSAFFFTPAGGTMGNMYEETGHREATALRRSVTVLAVGGTGESYAGDTRRTVQGLLGEVTGALDDRFDCRWVGYPARYGPATHPRGMSYLESLAAGSRELRAALVSTDGPVMLIGYSQGAVVVRRVVHDLWQHGDPLLGRILATGFVADPHQPPGVVPGCDGWGVAGPGPELPPRLAAYWVGIAGDAICNARADSFLRDIADITAAMALGRIRSWLHRLWQLLRHNDFQNAHRTSPGLTQVGRDVGRLWSAAGEVLGYLPGMLRWRGLILRNPLGGRHTSYAREPYRRRSVTNPDATGCEELAGWLQVHATFAGIGRTSPSRAA